MFSRFTAVLFGFGVIACAKKSPERAVVVAPKLQNPQEILVPKIEPLISPPKNSLADQLRAPDLLKELPKNSSPSNFEVKKPSSSVVIKATDENSSEMKIPSPPPTSSPASDSRKSKTTKSGG
jgi:hypothetical protein